MVSFLFSPTHIPFKPWSQPLRASRMPRVNQMGWPLLCLWLQQKENTFGRFSNFIIAPAHAQSLSCVWLFAMSWTIAHQAPVSTGLSRQECWSGLPLPSPGDLSNPGMEPMSPVSPALAGKFFYHCATWEALLYTKYYLNALLLLSLTVIIWDKYYYYTIVQWRKLRLSVTIWPKFKVQTLYSKVQSLNHTVMLSLGDH